MKFLIIRFSSIGDIVLTEPVSYVIQSNFPDAEIDFLTKKEFFPIIKSFRKIDNIYSEEDNEFYKKKYDIIIDLHSKFKSIFYSCILKSDRVIRYNKLHITRILITKKIGNHKINSTLDLYLAPLKRLGFHIQETKPVLSPEFEIKAENIYKDLSEGVKKIVAIFPGAKHKTKIYPPEYFKQFILMNNKNYRFVLLGAQKEKILSSKISEGIPEVTDLSGKLNLSETIYFLSKADIVITGDSGPMHIAAALSKPQIAIFGSTHPDLGFAPLNKKAVILQEPLPCRPCHIHGREKCPLKHFRCMKDISPYKLTAALKKLENFFE